jgi:hypothetical protein
MKAAAASEPMPLPTKWALTAAGFIAGFVISLVPSVIFFIECRAD